MGDLALDRTETTSVEAILRDELAREDRALSGVAPVIAHLLDNPGQGLVNDAIVASVRGMLNDLARQLLSAVEGGTTGPVRDDAMTDQLAALLARESELLTHLHSLAMEARLTERLLVQSSIDPVLSPLFQELIASDQTTTAEVAMTALAAQSRFMQSQRRMALPLGELPSELFLLVIKALRQNALGLDEGAAKRAIKALKKAYDEGLGRLGLLVRLVSAMRGGAIAGLELEHAGFALFASALATMTRQPRDLAVLACHERQAARLALSLRAAGLPQVALERQFHLLQPGCILPEGIGAMMPERAALLLASGDAETAIIRAEG